PAAQRGRWKTWRPLISSFSTTTWAVYLGVNILDAAGLPDWMAAGGVMAASAVLWLVLAGNLQSLREAPRSDAERLGACLGVQAAALLFSTIALAMSDTGEVLCWIALGVAAIVAGK